MICNKIRVSELEIWGAEEQNNTQTIQEGWAESVQK